MWKWGLGTLALMGAGMEASGRQALSGRMARPTDAGGVGELSARACDPLSRHRSPKRWGDWSCYWSVAMGGRLCPGGLRCACAQAPCPRAGGVWLEKQPEHQRLLERERVGRRLPVFSLDSGPHLFPLRAPAPSGVVCFSCPVVLPPPESPLQPECFLPGQASGSCPGCRDSYRLPGRAWVSR